MWLVGLVPSFARCGYMAGKTGAEVSKCDSVVVSVMATEIDLALGISS